MLFFIPTIELVEADKRMSFEVILASVMLKEALITEMAESDYSEIVL